MHDHLGTHLARGEVVNAACAVRHIGKEERQSASEALDNVGDSGAVHHQALGHLQRNGVDALAPDVVDRLGDLEVVVGRQGWCERERGRETAAKQ